MKVLGIDPGAECGWALWDGSLYYSGTWHLQPKGSLACGDHPLILLKGHLRQVWATVDKLDLVCFETPVGYQESIGRTVTAVSSGAMKCGIVISEADSHSTHWVGLKPGDVKGFARRHDGLREAFKSKGQASKEDMYEAARVYFHKTPNDHNEADALWVCCYGVENYEACFKAA